MIRNDRIGTMYAMCTNRDDRASAGLFQSGCKPVRRWLESAPPSRSSLLAAIRAALVWGLLALGGIAIALWTALNIGPN